MPTIPNASRREFLRLGALGVGGLTLADVLRLRARGPTAKKPRAVIMVCLAGGPSHLDMYDLKPGSADDIRGELRRQLNVVPAVTLGLESNLLIAGIGGRRGTRSAPKTPRRGLQDGGVLPETSGFAHDAMIHKSLTA